MDNSPARTPEEERYFQLGDLNHDGIVTAREGLAATKEPSNKTYDRLLSDIGAPGILLACKQLVERERAGNNSQAQINEWLQLTHDRLQERIDSYLESIKASPEESDINPQEAQDMAYARHLTRIEMPTGAELEELVREMWKNGTDGNVLTNPEVVLSPPVETPNLPRRRLDKSVSNPT